ncbi:COP9 complex subunit 7A [Syncephalis fuscata]|nr:COP9 complex subunit 7A [Syncephalis fuscata]
MAEQPSTAASSVVAQNAERLLLLLKSTRGASCVNLIQQALSAPGVYVFSEFVQAPNVQELTKDPQHVAYVELLKIFSYGTYEDYLANQSNLPALDSKQLSKLRQLTVVSLAAQRQTLPYPHLLEALHLSELREMESLVIEAIYGGILRGRLDQRSSQLHVDYAMGRDLSPGQLDQLAATLDAWCNRIDDALGGLDQRLAQARDAAKANAESKLKHEANCDDTKKKLLAKRTNRNAHGSSKGEATMVEGLPTPNYKRPSYK